MSEELKRPDNLSFKNAPIELKEDGDTRYIEAVFSLFDTIDSDNDVTKANSLKIRLHREQSSFSVES
jgi:hypothetical protein